MLKREKSSHKSLKKSKIECTIKRFDYTKAFPIKGKDEAKRIISFGTNKTHIHINCEIPYINELHLHQNKKK